MTTPTDSGLVHTYGEQGGPVRQVRRRWTSPKSQRTQNVVILVLITVRRNLCLWGRDTGKERIVSIPLGLS